VRPPAPLAERLGLMVITDPAAALGVWQAAEAALAAGAPAIQLRWKDARPRKMLELGRALRAATRARGALLIVNDRVDVALALEADGAHLGDEDLPLEVARAIVPGGFLLGRSVDSAAEGATAEAGGADYLGVGPVFPTSTKSDTGPVVGTAGIRELRERVRIPLVGIGGIDAGRADEVVAAGADGVAVIGAIMGSTDPGGATRELLEAIRRGVGRRG
jgi:thiamine-phosphate pyrophosphorylase